MPELPTRQRLLLLGTDRPAWSRARSGLREAGFPFVQAEARPEAIEGCFDPPFHLIIVDLDAVESEPDRFLARLRALYPAIPVLAVAPRSIETAERVLIDSGASEVLADPGRVQELVDAVRRRFTMLAERQVQQSALSDLGPHLEGIVGRSGPMLELYKKMARAASSSAPVLITGETGTGKELIAGALHRASGRGSFVPVNCGAIPSHLLESELFGHVRGAFTGAVSDRRGLFEEAHGGTLFLDEVAELPLPLQPKLLRALQSGEIRRVGEAKIRTVNVRLITATHRDLAIEVEEGRFREDLYFRIHVLTLQLPALRERPTDIPLLADLLLARIRTRDGAGAQRIAPGALAALVSFGWPGNVRQLQNVMERAALYGDGDEIRVEALPPELRAALPDRPIIRSAADRALTLAQLEREYTLEIMRRCGGNKSRAATILGVPRRTLYRRLASYGHGERLAQPV